MNVEESAGLQRVLCVIKLKKMVSKLRAMQGVCVCVWFRDRKIEGRERAAVCPSSCNKSCLFCYALHWPRCVLIDTSRQKNWGGTGIKLCVRSERQICLDFCPESCLI